MGDLDKEFEKLKQETQREPSINLEAQDKIVQFLLRDKEVPKPFRQNFWGFINKEIAVTNIKPDDVVRWRRKYRDAVYAFLMSQPDCMHNFEDEFAVTQGAMVFDAKARRSVDALERKMIATQIREVRSTYEEQTGGKGGFVSMFKRLVGGK